MSWKYFVIPLYILSIPLAGAFNPFRKLNINAIVSKSQSTNSGKEVWSKTFYCPEPTFVNGINPIFRHAALNVPNWFKSQSSGKIQSNPISIFGLNVSCSPLTTTTGSSEGQGQIQRYIPALIHSVSSAATYSIQNEDASICSPDKNGKPFGQVVGIEKRLSQNGSLIEFAFYCNYENNLSRQIDLTMNIGVTGGRWTNPFFCPWGQYLCGYKVQHNRNSFELLDFRVECCPALQRNSGWTNYRGETFGTVLQSLPMSSDTDARLTLIGHTRSNHHLHYLTQLNDPYYFKWEFCPVTTYIVGIQIHSLQRQFRFLCSDISQAKPRRVFYITGNSDISKDIWEESDELELECQGLAIGFQVLYEEVSAQIQGLRFLCSYSTNQEIPYIKAILPPPANQNAKYSWGTPQMCPRHQTLCGVKTRIFGKGQGQGLEHIQAKCCTVPSIAQICAPYDEYELIVECDSLKALADTTCTYTQTEGFTFAVTTSQSHNLGWDMRNSLSKEWSLTQTDTHRNTQESSSTSTQSKTVGNSNTVTNSDTISSSQTNSQTNSESELQGITKHESNSNTKSKQTGRTISTGTDRSKVFTGSTRTEQSVGTTIGESNTKGFEQGTNYLNTQSYGTTVSDSIADSFGISQGILRGRTVGSAESSSSGVSNGQSESGSNTQGNSQSHGSSFSSTEGQSLGVSAGAGGGFGPFSFDLKTNFEQSSSRTKGTNTENSNHASSTRGHENSQSVSHQIEQESSATDQSQVNKDLSASFTRNKGTEHNQQNTGSFGGHSTNSESNTKSKEQSQVFTTGTEHGWSDGMTHRQNEENSEQVGESVTNEFGISETNQKTKEQSNTVSNTMGREKTKTNSHTNNAEITKGQTNSKGVSQTQEKTNSKAQGGSETKDKTLRTGYDWSKSSEGTWKQEKSHQVTMNIPAGTTTKLFQVVGRCDNFQVRANNFKREDFTA